MQNDNSEMTRRRDLTRLGLEAFRGESLGVLVRTLATTGPATRPASESLLILDDGRRSGVLLDGRLDAAINNAVLGLRQSSVPAMRVAISWPDDVDDSISVEVLIQRLQQLPPRYWSPANPPDVAVTLLESPLGATVVVTADGALLGTLGDPELDRSVMRTASSMLRAARATTQVQEIAGRLALLEVRQRSSTLVLAGGGELAAATAALAETLGWATRASDDAAEVCAFLDDCQEGDALIVMSHDPALDEPVLVRAATAGLDYVGVLGSRRVHQLRHERLRQRGVPESFIARLRGPAGLDVGAWTPQETAVGIVAEILALRAGRSGHPLVETTSMIHPD